MSEYTLEQALVVNEGESIYSRESIQNGNMKEAAENLTLDAEWYDSQGWAITADVMRKRARAIRRA